MLPCWAACVFAICVCDGCDRYDEAARYLETYKAYEKKPADMLKEKIGGDYMSKVCFLDLCFLSLGSLLYRHHCVVCLDFSLPLNLHRRATLLQVH